MRHKNFRRFYFGYATSVLGTGMAPVGITFAVLDHGHDATDLGLVVTGSTTAMIGFLLLGGVAADRFGRRRVLLVSDVLRTLSQGLFAALVLLGDPPLWSLIAVSALTCGETPKMEHVFPGYELLAKLSLGPLRLRSLQPAIRGHFDLRFRR